MKERYVVSVQRNGESQELTGSQTQLFGNEKSWNLKETSPAVSRPSAASDVSPCSKFWGRSAGGIVGSSKEDRVGSLNCSTSALRNDGGCSHMSTWIRMGRRAWRCRENLWLSETVSKHLTAPDEDTIHGRIFTFDTLEITSSFDALFASLYRVLSPDRVTAASLSSSSITEEM